MSRNIGLFDGGSGTVYRAVLLHTTRGGIEHRRFRGLYDKPGPAHAIVTRELRIWAAHLVDIPEETVIFDAWVEPVTITNHPGVRL